MTCDRGHGEISYKGRKCPLCKTLDHNREMKIMLENLKFEMLVTEEEMLLNFSLGEEKKIFSYVGQA